MMMMWRRRRRRVAYVGQLAGGGGRLQGGDWGSVGLLGICRVKKDYSVEGYLHEEQRCGARAQCGRGSSSHGGDNDVRGPLRSQTLTSAVPTGAEKLQGKGGACDLTDVWSWFQRWSHRLDGWQIKGKANIELFRLRLCFSSCFDDEDEDSKSTISVS